MYLKEIINNILEIAKNKPNIRTAEQGNVYDLNSMPDVEYSAFWLTQGQHRLDEQEVTYNFTMFYIDRLTDDFSNKTDIQSDGIVELTNIINTIVNVMDCEVDYPLNFTVFNQRFAEECAGVFVNVNITVDNNMGNCYWE